QYLEAYRTILKSLLDTTPPEQRDPEFLDLWATAYAIETQAMMISGSETLFDAPSLNEQSRGTFLDAVPVHASEGVEGGDRDSYLDSSIFAAHVGRSVGAGKSEMRRGTFQALVDQGLLSKDRDMLILSEHIRRICTFSSTFSMTADPDAVTYANTLHCSLMTLITNTSQSHLHPFQQLTSRFLTTPSSDSSADPRPSWVLPIPTLLPTIPSFSHDLAFFAALSMLHDPIAASGLSSIRTFPVPLFDADTPTSRTDVLASPSELLVLAVHAQANTVVQAYAAAGMRDAFPGVVGEVGPRDARVPPLALTECPATAFHLYAVASSALAATMLEGEEGAVAARLRDEMPREWAPRLELRDCLVGIRRVIVPVLEDISFVWTVAGVYLHDIQDMLGRLGAWAEARYLLSR
ncbi:hypothetical protein HDU96_004031, partial [Phlyctochytrium bullatum]